MADQYLLEHFYETCSEQSKESIQCSGVALDDENYCWQEIALYGERKCGNCSFSVETCGFYYGKGVFSPNFENREYLSLMNIRSQEEFERACEKINPRVKGIVVRGAVTDAALPERFGELEFVALSGQRTEHLWDMSCNPSLRFLTIYGNKFLKSLNGIEKAENLECVQFFTHISEVNTVKIDSLEPLSRLLKLKEVILSATEPLDHNIDFLIGLPQLEYLWLSPHLFPTEAYAKFEAERFMLSEEYGIYWEDEEDIFPYGKSKRVMHTQEQKQRYLENYHELMKHYQ